MTAPSFAPLAAVSPDAWFGTFDAMRRATGALAAAPFDFLRLQYAEAVRAGVLPRSQLASARVEKQLDLMERLMLGPLARSV